MLKHIRPEYILQVVAARAEFAAAFASAEAGELASLQVKVE